MTAKTQYDAVVIGAGHNGLVTAAYLARAGLAVLLLERRHIPGGAASSEESLPGFTVDTGAWEARRLLPAIIADLNLTKRGVQFIEGEASIFAPQLNDRPLILWRDIPKAQEAIAYYSPEDAQAYPRFLNLIKRLADVVADILPITPPPINNAPLPDLLPWLRVALKARRLGKRDMMEFLRILPMPVGDLLDEWFESPALKAALGISGVSGSMAGPKSPGTAFMSLYGAVGSKNGLAAGGQVKGGMRAMVEALMAAVRQYGGQVHTETEVSGILLEGGKAVGVSLANGEQIRSRVVISNANPKHTFFDLVGARYLPVRFVRDLRNIRYLGSTARVDLALSGLPRFSSALTNDGENDDGYLSGQIVLCQDLEHLEKAYDEAKYGRIATAPCLEAVIPTVLDPDRGPAGKHLMSINVRYAAYKLAMGSWNEFRQRLGDIVVETLNAYAPGIRDLILDRHVMTPIDLERELHLHEGNIFHGQMSLDQSLFMRPVAGYGRYRTPINNLYLCGAGAHPGGGVSGAPGYNAAREILHEFK